MSQVARISRTGIDRRTFVQAGAWSAPLLVAAVAAPQMSASGGGPTATFAAQSWAVAVPRNVWSNFQLTGRRVDGGVLVNAPFQSGLTVRFTPPAGTTVSVRNIVDGTVVTNPDGSVTVTFVGGLVTVSLQTLFSGPGTATATINGAGVFGFTVTQTVV